MTELKSLLMRTKTRMMTMKRLKLYLKETEMRLWNNLIQNCKLNSRSQLSSYARKRTRSRQSGENGEWICSAWTISIKWNWWQRSLLSIERLKIRRRMELLQRQGSQIRWLLKGPCLACHSRIHNYLNLKMGQLQALLQLQEVFLIRIIRFETEYNSISLKQGRHIKFAKFDVCAILTLYFKFNYQTIQNMQLS